MVEIGQQAPDFTLKGAGGEEFTLSSVRDKHCVLLMFYPQDMTGG